MDNWGNLIFNVAMTIVAVWIVRRFWGSFFEKKKNTVWSVMVMGAYCVLQMLLQLNKGNGNVILTIVNIAFILVIAMTGYESKGKTKFFLLIVFCTVWLLLELLVFFVLNSLHVADHNANMLGEVISKIFMMLFIYSLSMFWGNKNAELIPNKFFIWLLLIPVGSIYISFDEFYKRSDTLSSVIIMSILLGFNVIIYELYIKMNEIFILEKESTVYAQQLEMIAGNTVEQKRIMEEFHEEKHDLINELIVLKNLICKENHKEAVETIDSIINGCHLGERISNTGNSTVDAIINFKYAVAGEYGINFKLNIFIPEEMPVEQKDLGVVLGNALDNAIEAVKNCRHSEKKIEISMGIKKEACVLVIKNPFENEIKKDRMGEIVSNKRDKRRHGYGLKSIRKIADKYQGEAIVTIENGIFMMTIILNFG